MHSLNLREVLDKLSADGIRAAVSDQEERHAKVGCAAQRLHILLSKKTFLHVMKITLDRTMVVSAHTMTSRGGVSTCGSSDRACVRDLSAIGIVLKFDMGVVPAPKCRW